MKNTLTFLGTGTSTGVPQIGCQCEVCTSSDIRDTRMRCSALLQTEGKNILIDCGPDFRQQAVRYRVHRIDSILLTHKHIDHIGGVDDLRPMGNTDIYLDRQTEDNVRGMYGYCFVENPYPGVPKLTLHQIDLKPFEVCGIRIVPIEVMHGKMPIKGYRIGDLAYLTDVSTIADGEIGKLEGLKVLVMNCLRIEPHPSHQCFEEAVAMAKRIGAERTFFTHMSHHIGLHKEAERMLEKECGMMFAYDGLKVEY